MDIKRRIRETKRLTPTEQQLASTVLSLGERLQTYSIKEFARAASASVPSVHRFCKKLGLEGFKELKVELARTAARRDHDASPVNINFPFSTGDRADTVAREMQSVYEATLHDTRELLDSNSLEHAAELIKHADVVDIYTQSHNLYPATMFRDRLLSVGKAATCFEGYEQMIRTALASDDSHLAIAISYSGLAEHLPELFNVLRERHAPCVLIGTPRATRLHPGLDAYLAVSDQESLQNRITQFASHIAVQYVLDTLFGSFFARDFQRCRAFLGQSIPYTRLPALSNPPSALPQDEYLAQLLRDLK